ncbi:MAG: hypothetical protein AB1755_05835 [Candidatus Omnitrophota bacterium]
MKNEISKKYVDDLLFKFFSDKLNRIIARSNKKISGILIKLSINTPKQKLHASQNRKYIIRR